MSLSALVIEGDPTVAQLWVEVFSQHGWFADAPRNRLRAAEALFSTHDYDLITVSYRFLSTTGVDIIRRIRELEHRKHTPILMLTAGPIVTAEALAAGATEVLYKPIKPLDWVAIIPRHIDMSVVRFTQQAPG